MLGKITTQSAIEPSPPVDMSVIFKFAVPHINICFFAGHHPGNTAMVVCVGKRRLSSWMD
jgi:hypothetical protein